MTTISVRITEQTKANLAKMALKLERDESWLVRKALDALIKSASKGKRGFKSAA